VSRRAANWLVIAIFTFLVVLVVVVTVAGSFAGYGGD
jgi:hypothetical protein